MSGGLRVDPSDATPLWKQLEDGLRLLVASGQFPRGRATPSVREMAQSLQVNPATVVKAYNRLIDAGIFTTTPGLGTFVTDRPLGPKADVAVELERAADRFAAAVVTLSASNSDAVAAARAALKRLRRQSTGESA